MLRELINNQQFIRFIFTGFLNTIFGYGTFSLFIYMNFHYSLAALLSTILSVFFNFKTIGKIVFKNYDNKLFFKFLFIYVIAYVMNIICLSLFNFIGYDNMYLNALILLLPMAYISYLLNKKYVFASEKRLC